MECSFCYAKIRSPFEHRCPNCGFPLNGSTAEQENFEEQHAELKQKIDEAESALSWARFAMLWPGLGGVIGSIIIYSSPPRIFMLIAGVLGCALFVGAYFAAAWKPVPVLMALLVLLLAGTALSYFNGPVPLSVLLLPALIFLTYANALYTSWSVSRYLGPSRAGRN